MMKPKARTSEIAARTGGIALHAYVHDSDLFGYQHFRDGRIVDEYCSDPEYFEPVPAVERERLHGRPQLLAEVLPDGRQASWRRSCTRTTGT